MNELERVLEITKNSRAIIYKEYLDLIKQSRSKEKSTPEKQWIEQEMISIKGSWSALDTVVDLMEERLHIQKKKEII